ncbi:SDR family NAD(P)-dependent oxidoreductase [Halomarina pelagica]|uniref:SDR family NAD(P)-dependent oxidoreductase n=1 Tax=Halomarina pelagica TaxID=2961599 RepID=UPI0020C4E66F|nr:SDR family oxidoreductase [Halomarina sp. BND7]
MTDHTTLSDESPDGRRPLALVTGASRGLGATVSTLLAREGYDLVVTARTATDLDARAGALREAGGSDATVHAVPGDVSDADHRRDLARVVEETGDGLDLLVNNASTLGPSPLPPLAEYPLGALADVFEVNAVAPLGLVQELLPALRARSGLVVNVTSDAASEGYPGWGGYGASKAALDLLSRTLAAEFDGEVAVVSVDPGDMRTGMHRRAFPGEDVSDRPHPDVTIPFWLWLLGRDPRAVSGRRFRAQGDRWTEAD